MGKNSKRVPLMEALECRTFLAADFTLVGMGDTQYIVEALPASFNASTQWVAAHATDPAYNIAFFTQQGDILRRGYSDAQTSVADTALNAMNGKVPYLVSIGNHDFDNQFDDLDHHVSSANFANWFGDSRYQGIAGSGFGGSSLDQRNNYSIFNGGGQAYLVLNIDWEANDLEIAWAQSVINSHRQFPVILTTHEYLGGSGRTTSPLDPAGNSGEAIFQKLVKPNPQIFLVLSGHTGAVAHQVSSTGTSNSDYATVYEAVDDYSGRVGGGSGYMQLFHFYPDQNTISVTSYSPYLNEWDTTSAGQYSFAIDFAKRFGFSNTTIANDDNFAGPSNTAIQGDVITNDFDPNGDVLTALLASGPANGSLTLNPNGTFTYTPKAGYHGSDSFIYTISDGANTSTATVNLRVNTAPVAIGEAVSTNEGKQVMINVAANDSDADGDAVRPFLASLPANGWVYANADGTFTYTPKPKFAGSDSFTYIPSDGIAKGAAVQVNVTVNATPTTVAYDYPTGETTTVGTRTGSYANLAATDGVEETITESSSATLDQRWQFNVTGGSEVSLCINAKRSDGKDEYHLQYSTNGSTWLDMIRLVPGQSLDITRINYDNSEQYQMWLLPSSTRGTLWIRATDTKSNSDVCSLTVDEMFVRSTGVVPVTLPDAPSKLSASYNSRTRKATLRWTDNSDNETGFRIWYSTNNGATWNVYASVAANATSFTTSELTSGLTYLFRVSAYNSAGESSFSDSVSVLTGGKTRK